MCAAGLSAPEIELTFFCLDCYFYVEFCSSYPHPPILVIPHWKYTPRSTSTHLLSFDWLTSMSFCTHNPTPHFGRSSTSIGTTQFTLALQSQDIANLIFIRCSSSTFCVPHFSAQNSSLGASDVLGVAPLYYLNMSDCNPNPHLNSQPAIILLHFC